MFLKTANEVKQERHEAVEATRADELTHEFVKMMDTWHSKPEPFDSKLEAYLLRCKSEILLSPIGKKEEGKNYFVPSSADSCPRELFHRLRGDERDELDDQPHQGRWKRMGTAFGEKIQRDLLYIHKHYMKMVGEKPPFVPLYRELELGGTIRKVPFWEEFAKKTLTLEHEGVEINIQGQPDGILKFKDGTTVGLEIKSKQTSYNRTSKFSMKEPEESHARQVAAYSLLYGVDEFIIMYGNLAKKSWDMDKEDYNKYPDLRAFYIKVSEDDKKRLLDYFASILKAVKENNPPKLDPDKWKFNRYKIACIKSMTREEFEEIVEEYETCVEEAKRLDKVPRSLRNRIDNLLDIIHFARAIKSNG